jgi:hypothetical protein
MLPFAPGPAAAQPLLLEVGTVHEGEIHISRQNLIGGNANRGFNHSVPGTAREKYACRIGVWVDWLAKLRRHQRFTRIQHYGFCQTSRRVSVNDRINSVLPLSRPRQCRHNRPLHHHQSSDEARRHGDVLASRRDRIGKRQTKEAKARFSCLPPVAVTGTVLSRVRPARYHRQRLPGR